MQSLYFSVPPVRKTSLLISTFKPLLMRKESCVDHISKLETGKETKSLSNTVIFPKKTIGFTKFTLSQKRRETYDRLSKSCPTFHPGYEKRKAFCEDVTREQSTVLRERRIFFILHKWAFLHIRDFFVSALVSNGRKPSELC